MSANLLEDKDGGEGNIVLARRVDSVMIKSYRWVVSGSLSTVASLSGDVPSHGGGVIVKGYCGAFAGDLKSSDRICE